MPSLFLSSPIILTFFFFFSGEKKTRRNHNSISPSKQSTRCRTKARLFFFPSPVRRENPISIPSKAFHNALSRRMTLHFLGWYPFRATVTDQNTNRTTPRQGAEIEERMFIRMEAKEREREGGGGDRQETVRSKVCLLSITSSV